MQVRRDCRVKCFCCSMCRRGDLGNYRAQKSTGVYLNAESECPEVFKESTIKLLILEHTKFVYQASLMNPSTH